jgi:hypothetical protein
LAPCDFFLFSYKEKLEGASFDDGDQLLQAIDAMFHSIEKVTVFQTWRGKLAESLVASGGLQTKA